MKILLAISWIFCTLLTTAQECGTMRNLRQAEETFQKNVVTKLQAIFEDQHFDGYVLDKESDSYPPQVWTKVCIDRKPTEVFNMIGWYTYALDPIIEENMALLNQVNTIDYSQGEVAMDKLRNIGNIIRLECEWGINTIPFTIKNLGAEITTAKIGEVTIFKLNNALHEDSKSFDYREQTVVVLGNIAVVEEVETGTQGKIFKKTISVPTTSTQFSSKLNAFLVITGGKHTIHQNLNLKKIINQLNELLK